MKTYLKLVALALTIVFTSCSENQELNDDILNQRVPKDIKCETAFAYCEKTGTCFADTEPDSFNRWGWVLGPIEEGYYGKCEVYAGAGRCNLGRATMVGWIDYWYEDGEVRVIYTAEDGFKFYETHLYVGNNMYPSLPNGKPTVAPGQYPYGGEHSEGMAQITYNLDEEFEGEIYVIAHAVVCME